MFQAKVSTGGHPTSVAFLEDGSSIVVANHTMSGSSLRMFGEENSKSQSGSKPPPEIKWAHQLVHDNRAIINLTGVLVTYGTADGSTVFASCSEGTLLIESKQQELTKHQYNILFFIPLLYTISISVNKL